MAARSLLSPVMRRLNACQLTVFGTRGWHGAQTPSAFGAGELEETASKPVYTAVKKIEPKPKAAAVSVRAWA